MCQLKQKQYEEDGQPSGSDNRHVGILTAMQEILVDKE
jgi:hypothetical protein